MLRRIEISARVSIGCSDAESESCGAKLIITFTFNGSDAVSRDAIAGSFLNGSMSAGCTALGGMSRAICLSLLGSVASDSQLKEQTRSARSRISQSMRYL